MFTIKHMRSDHDETLSQAAALRLSPGTPIHYSPDGKAGQSCTTTTLWCRERHDSEELPLTGGVVYVMNESGKTVAHYLLEPERAQQ